MRLEAHRLRAIPHSVLVLSFSGALPFILAALLAWAGPPSSGTALTSLTVYGGVILSFLGGSHWGHAMGQGRTSIDRAVSLGAGPSLPDRNE